VDADDEEDDDAEVNQTKVYAFSYLLHLYIIFVHGEWQQHLGYNTNTHVYLVA